eukprot:6490704-Amphidinium_carterae.4
MRYLHIQQLQSDGELKIHKVSTENNPSDLMTKYLETAKIKKHSETIGLHPYLGNRSINMIGSRGQLRPRGSYNAATCQDLEERRRNQGSDYLSTLKRMTTQKWRTSTT